jgi:SAM-dependent methyltransferase
VNEPVNIDQSRAWDGEEGDHWSTHAERYDSSLREHNAQLQAGARIAPHERVLDVGCGNGVSTRDAARRASAGHALGIDLSSAMLAVARATSADEGLTNVEFTQADAQTHPFTPGFDVVISRFGVMFFEDPVAAFSNIFGAVTPGGRLALVVWKSLGENEWFAEVGDALAIGRDIAPPPPGAPGPFGLADADYVNNVLGAAGFTAVQLDPFHARYYAGDNVDDAYEYARGLGFTRRMLQGLDDTARARALEALRTMIAAHGREGEITFDSACWLITAGRP